MSIRTFRSSSGLTLAGLVMLLGAALPKQPVHGTVKGSQGDPKQFASVSLDGPGHYAAITDANGSFVIQEVSPGTTPSMYVKATGVGTFSMSRWGTRAST